MFFENEMNSLYLITQTEFATRLARVQEQMLREHSRAEELIAAMQNIVSLYCKKPYHSYLMRCTYMQDVKNAASESTEVAVQVSCFLLLVKVQY